MLSFHASPQTGVIPFRNLPGGCHASIRAGGVV
jgi:hypothetical protein